MTTLLTLCLSLVSQASHVEVVVGSKDGNSPLKRPFGVDFTSKGDMIIVELEGGRVHRFRDGKLSLFSGDGSRSYKGDGGPAKDATYNGMHNVAVTPNDDIYIADSWNHCIRKIYAKTGVVSTIAGTGRPGFGGDGGPATKAKFDYIMCITLNPSNDKLFVADLKNRRIRVVDLKTGIVTTVAGNGKRGKPRDGADALKSPLVDPRAVTVDSKNRVYILERGGHALRVVEDGKIRTVAGTGKGGFRDGPALKAQFRSPKHLCVDGQDRVIIADDVNRRIRLFDPTTKKVTTLLGEGAGDAKIRLSHPHGVCIEGGMLYIVDTSHHRILRMKHLP